MMLSLWFNIGDCFPDHAWWNCACIVSCAPSVEQCALTVFLQPFAGFCLYRRHKLIYDVSVDRFMSICRWSLTLFIHSILLRFSVTMAVMIRCNSTRLSSFKAGHLPRVAKTMWNNDRTLLMVMWFFVKVLFFQRHLKYLVMAAAISWLRKLRCLSRGGGDRYFSFPPAPQAVVENSHLRCFLLSWHILYIMFMFLYCARTFALLFFWFLNEFIILVGAEFILLD